MDSTKIIQLLNTSIIIAVFGFLASLITAYYTAVKTIKTEKTKVNSTVSLTYTSKLLEKRFQIYPEIYFILSSYLKKLHTQQYTLEDINEFQDKFNNIDSNYSLFFSSVSARKGDELRRYLINILDPQKNTDRVPTEDEILKLTEIVAKVENALKEDLGIYIVEFDDPEKTYYVRTYDSANHLADTLDRKRKGYQLFSKLIKKIRYRLHM